MTEKSKAWLLSLILGILIPLAGLSFSKADAAPTATYTRETSEAEARLIQLDQARKKKERETFAKMCEFLRLDDKQAETAVILFEARLKEIDDYLTLVAEGTLKATEAHLKMVESFKKYRKQFEEMLNEEQKTRLSIWEKQGASGVKKNRASRG